MHTISNVNGRRIRSQEFGSAISRGEITCLSPYNTYYRPAISFGETGVATGAIAICMGVEGLYRGYMVGNHILIWLTSENEERGSFFIKRALS